MGRRGPRPSPTVILEGHASWRAKRNKREPQPEKGHVYCPRWIDRDAKRMWRSLVPLLSAAGMLTKVDAAALTRYCQAWSRWKKAEEFLQKYGETYPLKDDQGRLRCFMPYPQVSIANQLSHTLTRLEQEFGLTPSARTRIQVDGRPASLGPQPGDRLAALMYRKGAFGPSPSGKLGRFLAEGASAPPRPRGNTQLPAHGAAYPIARA